MATKYAVQQIGVADGTEIPALKADGRQVNARRHCIIASKPAGVAWANGDVIFLGKKPAGSKIVDIKVCTGTSFSTTTLDVGDGTTADRYVDGATNTVVDKMVSIGPKASTLDDDPLDAEEEIWLTVLTTDIGSAVLASFLIELASQ